MKKGDYIICLVGESGSGKTTIAQALDGPYNIIHSYTTRSPRHEDEWGHTFVTMEAAREMMKSEEVVAHDYYDENHYFAIADQYRNQGVSMYVVNPPGVKFLKDRVDDAEIIVIYIKVDNVTRRGRMKKDGRSPLSINDRIAYDREMFKMVECDYCLSNINVGDAVGLIQDIIYRRCH